MEQFEISMNEKQLTIALSGMINGASVRQLIKELDAGFDYYQFPQITLSLDSPGGEYVAMLSLMSYFKSCRLAGRRIDVCATQTCASAAALLLASGSWGTRTVVPETQLLFHWARAQFQAGQVLTSEVAARLARGLTTVDQRLLEQLVDLMCEGVGGEAALVGNMARRLDEMLEHWNEITQALSNDAYRSPAKQTDWVKQLQRHIRRWTNEPDAAKQKSGVVAYLNARFEKDSLMDLRQAYSLCLIDVVKGVLPWHQSQNNNKCDAAMTRCGNNQKIPVDFHERSVNQALVLELPVNSSCVTL